MRMNHAHLLVYDSPMLDRTRGRRRPKKAANLSVDAALLERARRLKLNLSQAFEEGLLAAIRRSEAEEWLRRNQRAIEAYNAHVDKHGVFSDGLRSF